LKKALPGPFTFIFNASGQVPKLLSSKKKTVGIRIPDNNIVREIVKALGNPIVTTSIRDEDDIIEYSTDPELIYEKYEDKVDLVIDGGYGDNVASTVVDLTSGEFEIIREGKGDLDLYL
jgi:tRNA threonylcarbamoyl adenosine modification protein (Sua5/YciO/YrdC/YwlC family)